MKAFKQRDLVQQFTKTAFVAALSLTAAGTVPLSAAHAGATVSFGDDKSVSLGLGMRSSFSTVEDGAPNGTSRSTDFALDSARIYMGASLSQYIKGTLDTEIDSATSTMRVIDAIAQFEFMPEFNVWAGRMLPPSDRANLDGPYYENTWDYPDVSNYPSLTTGRDDGVTVWGKVFAKHLVYAVGVFEGPRRPANTGGRPLFAGRVAYDILDVEDDPAYYTGSTYYGNGSYLTLAVAGMVQKDSDGVPGGTAHDYKSWNADLLFEKPFDGIGTVTLEGAYYNYNTGKDAAAELSGNAAPDAKAYLLTGEYMFPGKVAWGFVQPFVRYQHSKSETFGTTGSRVDVGVNYVIAGPNARITAVYSNNANLPGAAGSPPSLINPIKKNKFLLGVQLQF